MGTVLGEQPRVWGGGGSNGEGAHWSARSTVRFSATEGMMVAAWTGGHQSWTSGRGGSGYYGEAPGSSSSAEEGRSAAVDGLATQGRSGGQ
jgi:hypothetical protein